jgi:REP element-mobilizing transposase RayT
LLREITTENESHSISGKVAVDHVHMFLSYRALQNVCQIVHWIKGTRSRFPFQEFPHPSSYKLENVHHFGWELQAQLCIRRVVEQVEGMYPIAQRPAIHTAHPCRCVAAHAIPTGANQHRA